MKKLSYLFILLLFPIVAFAQEATVQDKENKEKIKEIKLSEDYVYADAVTEENLSEAQQNSMDLLRTNVNAIFAERFHMSKEDVEDIWDVIEDKCQNVTIKKGDLFRVFTYIMKDYLFPGKKKKKVKNEELAEVRYWLSFRKRSRMLLHNRSHSKHKKLGNLRLHYKIRLKR